jgi:hypothetical protein
MTNDELEAALRAYNRRQPFRTFLLEFISGTQVRVENREAVAFFKPLWLYRGPSRAQALFPSSCVCRLLDISPGQ